MGVGLLLFNMRGYMPNNTLKPWTFDSMYMEILADGVLIAEICGPINSPDVLACAHLIKAAPTLLKACREVLATFEVIAVFDSYTKELPIVALLGAAIAEAEGRS